MLVGEGAGASAALGMLRQSLPAMAVEGWTSLVQLRGRGLCSQMRLKKIALFVHSGPAIQSRMVTGPRSHRRPGAGQDPNALLKDNMLFTTQGWANLLFPSLSRGGGPAGPSLSTIQHTAGCTSCGKTA